MAMPIYCYSTRSGDSAQFPAVVGDSLYLSDQTLFKADVNHMNTLFLHVCFFSSNRPT